MSKLQKLKAEIKRIEQEEEELLKSKYQHLVGKYLHRAHTSYEKITNVDRVDTDDQGEEIHFDCVSIYWDSRGDEYNSNAHVTLSSFGSIYEEDIEGQTITKDQFHAAFEGCIDLIKRSLIV